MQEWLTILGYLNKIGYFEAGFTVLNLKDKGKMV